MTTVACNRECMAADTYITDGTRSHKILRTGSVLVGMAGDFWYSEILAQWLLDGKRGPVPAPGTDEEKEVEQADLLILRKDGIYVMNCHGIEIRLLDDFSAVGSGSEYALGAMAAGATPEEAVRIACRFDSSTKEPVHTEWLKRRRDG